MRKTEGAIGSSKLVPREEWEVLIRGAALGYITGKSMSKTSAAARQQPAHGKDRSKSPPQQRLLFCCKECSSAAAAASA